MAQDYDDVEHMMRKLIEEYKKWGLEVNLPKAKYMCIGGAQRDLLLEDGQAIKSCETYKYLGMYISSRGTLDYAIKERNNQGRKHLLVGPKFTRQNKHLIYNTIIKSIVTYSSEVWPLKERTMRTLEAIEMDFWRRAAGRPRTERVPNEAIRTTIKVGHTISDEIRTKQLKWYGHVKEWKNSDCLNKYSPGHLQEEGRGEDRKRAGERASIVKYNGDDWTRTCGGTEINGEWESDDVGGRFKNLYEYA
ncbi:uncharacterized protein LOC132702626 [Cylas formicarius]|uniref:uncharacterized protein LOC132702626 n=1 Tax=Cylas formicarius TaxID=197179 RepID=UPI002958D46F|nr:uncharacterized protein LOC132702626 [Cylas formicarius]